MSERQFTDEEVAAIFKRASEEEHTAPVQTTARGMTLPALQEIGREVGLSADSISRAARALDPSPPAAPSQAFLGLPVSVGRTLELDHALSERDWELLVADLRATFQARGKLRTDGSFRQWTNGNLQALIEPTATGTRLRLKTMNANSLGLMTIGIAGLGVSAATAIGTALAGSLGNPSTVSGIGIMATIAIGLFGIGAFRLPGWARRRKDQMDEVSARLAATASHNTESLPDVR